MSLQLIKELREVLKGAGEHKDVCLLIDRRKNITTCNTWTI